VVEAIEVQRITDWLVETTLGSFDLEKFFPEFCQRVANAGIDICRGHIGVKTLHPLYNSLVMTWQQRRGLLVEKIGFDVDPAAWERSPLSALIQSGEEYAYYDLEAGNNWQNYTLLKELSEAGNTGYLGLLIPFGRSETTVAQQDGLVASWATDKEGGFSDPEILALRRLSSRLALAVKVHKREQTASNVLNAYLGEDAGQRVLNGRIQRGDVDSIDAIVWYSDLRESTRLAAELEPQEFMTLLSSYFERTGQPITDHGGSILKFVGDAILGIFPVNERVGLQRASREAVQAAWESVESLKNEKVMVKGVEESLVMGVGLHFGKILFGNAGLPDRLEFTMIGATVNETCRIEGLTKTSEHSILVSETIKDNVPIEWDFIGQEELRGVPELN